MENNNSNYDSNQKENLINKKQQLFIIKIVILLLLILLPYFGLKYYIDNKVNDLKSKSITSQAATEDEVFDLSSEYKNDGSVNYTTDDIDLDLTIDELKKNKNNLTYRILLKNQIAIKDLNQEISDLKSELEKRKNQESVMRIVYSYSDLRQKIFSGQNCNTELKDFELLIINNDFLEDKYNALADNLKDFKSAKILATDFRNLIPQIIASQNNNPNDGLIQKIKYNLSKLVVIRRIAHPEIDDLDGILLQIENEIASESYSDAVNLVTKISDPKSNILEEFLLNLNAAANVKQLDSEILYYLKAIASNK